MSQGSVRLDRSNCQVCGGTSGHHFEHCPEVRVPAFEEVSEVTEVTEEAWSSLKDVSNLEPGDEIIYSGLENVTFRLPPTSKTLFSNELIWLIAKTCHEVNRAYCAAVMSDHSQRPWEEASEHQRLSCYDGVFKHYENPDLTPEESHNSWLAFKRADGWTYGNMKSEEAKTHPSMLPYDQLHAHDRAKDALFAAVCKSMFGA